MSAPDRSDQNWQFAKTDDLTHAKHRAPDGSEVVAADRKHLLAQLAEGEPVKPWRVVRQYNHLADVEVHAHRWEWLAELCAYWRERGHPNEVGVHYTVRRAER